MPERTTDSQPSDHREVSRPQRVLVADDNDDARDLWSTYLTMSGFEVTGATNGADAVAKAVDGLPAVILMDYSMPVMDGADAVRAIRSHPRTATTPVIGFTGYGLGAVAGDFGRLCDIILEKPIAPEDLLEAVRRVLRRG